MSTIESTVSMMELMPEDTQVKVLEFAQSLLAATQPDPFVPLTAEQILADLAKSREQAKRGECRPAEDVFREIGISHGFI
ncbi:MAG: hypothetical protein LUG57_02385 [Oscillospiraceae bacterium]|nr:hypothetical protein [Oscillospiraceae bacterium]